MDPENGGDGRAGGGGGNVDMVRRTIAFGRNPVHTTGGGSVSFDRGARAGRRTVGPDARVGANQPPQLRPVRVAKALT